MILMQAVIQIVVYQGLHITIKSYYASCCKGGVSPERFLKKAID